MTDSAACEQVVLAWSSSNLLGNSGMGPIAASAGWNLSPRDPLAGLGESGRYLPRGAETLLSEGATPPVALQFLPGREGTLLIAKVYASSSQRAGHYQVHALRDGSGRCSPWDLWAARERGALITDQLARDLPMRLPEVSLDLVPPPDPPGSESDLVSLGILVERLLSDRVFTIQAESQADAERSAQRLLAYLPVAVSRQIPVNTFAAEPSASLRGMALVIRPFSKGFVEVDLDLDDPARIQSQASLSTDLAKSLVDASRAELDGLSSWDELQAWAALRWTDLSALSSAQLHGACGTTLFPTFLERLAHEPRSGEVLLRILADPPSAERFAASVTASAGEYGDLLATLFVNNAGVSPPENARVQDWLISLVGDEEFGRYLLGPLLAESASHQLVVDGPALAGLLAHHLGGRGELGELVFRTTTPTWSALSQHQLYDHLTSGRELPTGIRDLVREEPVRLARVLDIVIAADASSLLMSTLLSWPVEDTEVLLEAILRSRSVDKVMALSILDNKPVSQVNEILVRWWPKIARALRFPDGIVQQLVVKKQHWWERWD